MDNERAAQYASASLTNHELRECIRDFEYDLSQGIELDETDQLLHKAALAELEIRKQLGRM